MIHSKLSMPVATLLLAVSSSAGLAAGAAAAPTALTMSYSQKTIDFLPVWIASDAGYFKQQGLDVTVRYLPAQEGIPAVISGQEQIVGIGGADGSSADARGANIKLVLTLTPIYFFQLWAQPQYASAAKLKGQRIGITSTTGSLYAATLLTLKQLGLKPQDVVLTPLGGIVNVNSSLLAGSIAAALSHPPASYKFKKAGLVDLVDMTKQHIPSVNAGVWVTDSYIKSHRDMVQRVVNAISEALKREKSDRAFAEAEMSKFLGIKDKGELDFSYDFYVKQVLGPGPIPEAAQLQSNIDALAPSNPKVKGLDPNKILDQSFATAAAAK